MAIKKLQIPQVTIVGAGFTGLTTAYELAKRGIKVTVIESSIEIGGLAAAFEVGNTKLDCFYHHWFTNDLEVMKLVKELGLKDNIEVSPTNTGVFYANNFFKLSTPWDLLNFTPLNILDRLKLGILALRARRIKNWRELEDKTAHEWLTEIGGKNVYRIIWEPLLKGKFGPYAKDISAVWFWNKLKLRGGSRGKNGEEKLVYLKGGFISLAEALAKKIREMGGEIILGQPVLAVEKVNNHWEAKTYNKTYTSSEIILTTALPIIAEMIKEWADQQYIDSLLKIQYIGNICLVMELNRSLSKTYWLNVNDPSFPFVGVIEHTNFEGPENYGGRHIVYLSKYLPTSDKLFSMSADEFLDFSIPFLKKMFPDFERKWVTAHHLWRAQYSQPVVEKHYSLLIPQENGPVDGMYICTMAQIYPEDRGTNYAIREGCRIAQKIYESIFSSPK